MSAVFDLSPVVLRPQPFMKTIHVARASGAVYVNNPKVACSTIKLALQRTELGDPAYHPASSVHDHDTSPLYTWPELKIIELGLLLERHFVFSFVRCPYRRLQSAYVNKIVEPQKAGRPRQHAGFEADELPSFEAFIRSIADQDLSKHNPHWRPQWINLSIDVISYDFIGRLENFRTDWARLSTQLGLGPEPERAGKRTSPGQAVYTPETAALVARAYARDFEAFGYDPDAVP